MKKNTSVIPYLAPLLGLSVSVILEAPTHAEGGISVPDGYEVNVLAAGFQYPQGVAVRSDGEIFVADNLGQKVHKITEAGQVDVFAELAWPDALAFRPDGTLMISQSGAGDFSANEPGTISQIDPDGAASVFASVIDYDGLALDSLGDLYASAGKDDDVIFKVDPAGAIDVFAGTLPFFTNPDDVAVDSQGFVFAVDGNCVDQVRKFDPDGVSSVFATGLGCPVALAMRSDDTLFVGDFFGTIYQCPVAGGCQTFASGMEDIVGLALAPGGALYVTQRAKGNVLRISLINPLDIPALSPISSVLLCLLLGGIGVRLLQLRLKQQERL